MKTRMLSCRRDLRDTSVGMGSCHLLSLLSGRSVDSSPLRSGERLSLLSGQGGHPWELESLPGGGQC